MMKRKWLGSGIIEHFDKRQQSMLNLVLEKVRFYYRELYETRPCYRHPLCISQLAKLCKRNGTRTLMAVRILSHSVAGNEGGEPPLVYERVASERNAMHRPYRIFLGSAYTHRIGDNNELRR